MERINRTCTHLNPKKHYNGSKNRQNKERESG